MKSSKSYTATYEPEEVLGENGYTYKCFCDGRLVFEGWSRGKKHEAEAVVRQGIKNRDAIIAAFAGAPMAVA